MKLLWATEDLLIGGTSYPGFPIVLWDNMESCSPANDFLRYYLLRGAIGSSNSWPATGRAIYDFFSFLQVHDLDWTDVDRGERKTLLAGYRDYSLGECGLARSTVRQRLLYVCEFYEYAHREGWVTRLPFSYEQRMSLRNPGPSEPGMNPDKDGSSRDVMPKRHKTLPKFLSRDEVRRLLDAVDNPHHRMMIRLGLQTGLRREEIATFPLAYVFDPEKSGVQERNVRILLDPRDGNGIRTKGAKVRTIYVSRRFLGELHRYATLVRGERASRNRTKHRALFLNQFGDPYAQGGKRLERIVRIIGKKAGLRVNTHMLRHTYATHTLAALQRSRSKGGIEPLVFLQRQLGHSSIETTMVYLHLINELADGAVLAYDDELNNFAEDHADGEA